MTEGAARRGLATALGELVATLRTAAWPLARLVDPLPPPPPGGRPVVLVHGYLAHPEVFRPLVRRLYAAGRGRVLRPGYQSTQVRLDDVVAAIDAAARSAGEPVDLVGHSLGAVACRAYLKRFGGAARVRRFVSLGGPHAGTALWRLAPPLLHDVLRPDGPWVRALAEGPEPVPTVVIRARWDQQVLPPIRASLPGVEERVLDGLGHNGLLWSPRAHDAVLDVLAG